MIRVKDVNWWENETRIWVTRAPLYILNLCDRTTVACELMLCPVWGNDRKKGAYMHSTNVWDNTRILVDNVMSPR